MHQPPVRGRHILAGKRVLLVDPYQPARHIHAGVLQSHDMEVHVAESLSVALCLWRPKLFDWVLLDVRRFLPGELLAFYEQIGEVSSRVHFVFFVGPPEYVSLSLPVEVSASSVTSVA